jgi:hypothetical protein
MYFPSVMYFSYVSDTSSGVILLRSMLSKGKFLRKSCLFIFSQEA